MIFKQLTSKIGVQLLIIISLVLILSMSSLIYLVRNLVAEFGEYSASENEKNIRDKTNIFLTRITQEQAMRYENTFRKIAASSSLLAKQAEFFLEHTDLFGEKRFGGEDKLTLCPNGIFSNAGADTTMVLYWGPRLTPDIYKQLNALSCIDPLLIEIKTRNPESAACYIVTESAITRYYPNIHAVVRMRSAEEYDFRNSGWYNMARPENNPEGMTLWTNIYQDEAGQGLMTTAVSPVYNKSGQYAGLAGVDVTLNRITDDILGNEKSGMSDDMEGMFSFLIDNTGRIVAFPRKYLSLFGLGKENDRVPGYGAILERSFLNSDIADVWKAGQSIIRNEQQVSRIRLHSGTVLMYGYPMPSVGWHLGVVVSESVILSSVRETRNALDSVVKAMNARFTSVTLLFLACSIIIIVIFSVRRFIRPLNSLTRAALRIKQGDLTARVAFPGDDEIGILTRTFNLMAEELLRSDRLKKEYTVTLEQKVEERTEELTARSNEQEKTLKLLEQEIGERRQAEERLRESEEKYRDIFENSVEGIFQTSPDNRMLSANPAMARIFGYDSADGMLSEVVNVATQLYVNPEQRKEFIRILEENAQVSGFEFQFRRKDGGVRWGAVSARSVRDSEGKLLHIQGSVEDITERRQAEEMFRQAKKAAEDASRAKSDFLAAMSHEIRTPLCAVTGMTEKVLDTPLNPEQRRCLGIVRKSSDQLLALIDNILDLSKIEAKKLDLEQSAFDLEQILSDAVDLFVYQAEQKGIRISYSINEDVPLLLKGDCHRLRQIMVNLAGNAVKFTDAGEIRIHAALDKERNNAAPGQKITLFFTVKDTGIGILQDKLESIFEDFTQADGSYTRKYGGTGLGLSISKRLVHLMEGDIGCESEPGKGSTFFFTARFGLLEPDETEAFKNRVIQATDPEGCGAGLHILLAEDFEVNQDVITALLEKRGYSVHVVSDGKAALEAVKRERFDLVLMDVQMPVMDGVEAVHKIRSLENPELADIPVVALTAHAVEGDREKFLHAGMDAYVSKPIKAEELLKAIHKVSAKKVQKDSAEKAQKEKPGFIDLDYALKLMDNDEEVLLKGCESIMKNLPLKLNLLNEAIIKKDCRTVERIAHSIKAAAKSIGAGQAAETAYQLERSGNENDMEKAEKLMPAFEEHIRNVLKELESFL